MIITGATIGFLFGGWSELLTALIVLQGLDVVLGLMKAGRRREISSRAMLIGVERKLGVWISLILANVIDSVVFNGQPVAMTGLVFSFISYEGLSIVENLALIGVPLPEWLTKMLIQVRMVHDERMQSAIKSMDSGAINKVILESKTGEKEVIKNDRDTQQLVDDLTERCDECGKQ